jgi:hypothetical protein
VQISGVIYFGFTVSGEGFAIFGGVCAGSKPAHTPPNIEIFLPKPEEQKN